LKYCATIPTMKTPKLPSASTFSSRNVTTRSGRHSRKLSARERCLRPGAWCRV
jgi:hypothetical protein